MKKITTLALGLLLASAAFAQKGNKAEVLPSLQSTLGKHFLIGVAVDTRLPAGQDPAAEAIVKEQFNQVVAENCMKVSAASVANNPVVFTQEEITDIYKKAM